jgi:hypothetical protein
MKKAVLWVAATTVLGCSDGGTVDIGDDNAATLGQQLEDFAGNWDGYAEAYRFTDDSDRVRINLDPNGQGTIEVGELPPYPPASDFNVGYPPGVPMFDYIPHHLEPGFVFSLHSATVDARRIRLSVDAHEPFRPWCQMQTPEVEFDDGTVMVYGCAVGAEGRTEDGCFVTHPMTGLYTPIDCVRLDMCNWVCGCTATECDTETALAENAEAASNVKLDAALSEGGTVLDGTLLFGAGPNAERVPIRVTRR